MMNNNPHESLALIKDLLSGASSHSASSLSSLSEAYPYTALFPIALARMRKDVHIAYLVYRYNVNPTLYAVANRPLDIHNRDIDTVSTPVASIEPAVTVHHLSGTSDNAHLRITDDYLSTLGNAISHELPTIDELSELEIPLSPQSIDESLIEQSLLVQMTFGEWLRHISHNKRMEREEEEEQKALKNKWRQEKLAAAIQEELDDIPDEVFQKAVDSISNEEDTPSESMAAIYTNQGKYDKALSIYKKLILLFPEKKPYFATQIEKIQDKKNKI